MPPVFGYSPFDSGQISPLVPLNVVGDESFDTGLVRIAHGDLPNVAAADLLGLLPAEVAIAYPSTEHLAGARNMKTRFRAFMCFEFGHLGYATPSLTFSGSLFSFLPVPPGTSTMLRNRSDLVGGFSSLPCSSTCSAMFLSN